MKEIIERTFLKETIEYPDKIVDLKEKIRLKKEKGFYLDWISEKEFKVESKISVGTIMMNYNLGFFDGIKGYGKLTELNGNKTKIDLTTKVRIEMYFIGAFFVVFLLVELLFRTRVPDLGIYDFSSHVFLVLDCLPSSGNYLIQKSEKIF